ncbi:MAG: hypothetical protein ACLFWG_05745 [Longimicrobiales bacterium]
MRSLSPGGFARFYAPLAATSLLLTATNPLLTAALARSANPAAALAGFSVAFALCGVLYSPLLVVQQVAATRILEGRDINPVRRFALATGALFSGLTAAVAFTPLGGWVFGDLVGVRGSVFVEAMDAIAFLWPIPLLTGIRAAHQGRLVGKHRTHPIAVATSARTAVLAAVAFGLTLVMGGAWVGGAAFVAGLLVEASIVGFSRVPDSIPPHAKEAPSLVDAALEGGDELLRFSTPLMLNVFLWWSTPLIINAVLARTPQPELALASFAVVEAVAWFVTAPVGQYQHASIALVGDRTSHRKVRRWAGVLAAGVFVLLGILALPWIARPGLDLVFQLDSALLESATAALPLAAFYPLLYGHRQYYQGLFVRVGCPGVVGTGAVLRVTSLVLTAVLLVDALGGYGAAFGVGLHAFGLAVEGGFLLERSRVRVLPALEVR